MRQQRKHHSLFMVQSFLLWGSMPVLSMFLPSYFQSLGMDALQIGLLLALGPALAIVLPLFVGTVADRARSKNLVLMVLTAGTALLAAVFPLASSFGALVVVSLLLAAFQSGQTPLSEAITLEGLHKLGESYGPVRLAGTVGFTVLALVLGPLLKYYPHIVFVAVAFLALINVFVVAKLPRIEGHQSSGARVPLSSLLRNRVLLILLGYSLVANLSMQCYNAFFSVYFIEQGGSPDQIGFLLALAAISELPFLLWADRILARFGLKLTLVAAMGVVVLRFVALVVLQAPVWLYPLSLLNGMTFIVFAYGLAVSVARDVPKELRATGQTVLGVASAIGRTIGALGGGALAQAVGLAPTFLVVSALAVAATLVFLWLTRKDSLETAL